MKNKVILLVSLLAVLGIMVGGNTTESTVKITKEPLAGISGNVQVGEVVFNVNKAYRTNVVDGRKGSFLVFEIDIENKGNATISKESLHFNLNDAFNADILFMEDIDPGVTQGGKIIFNVPKHMVEGLFNLNVRNGNWGSTIKFGELL